MDLPLLDDDLAPPGLIEPSQAIKPGALPACVVLCCYAGDTLAG